MNTSSPLTILQTGGAHPLWTPQFTSGANCDADLAHFVVGIENPSVEDVERAAGHVKFGLLRAGHVLMLNLIIPGVVDVSVPYNAHVAEASAPEPYSGDECRLVSFSLVDAPTGEVLSMRAATLSPHISRELSRTIDHQLRHPIHTEEFLDDVANCYRRYPTGRAAASASTYCSLGDHS